MPRLLTPSRVTARLYVQYAAAAALLAPSRVTARLYVQYARRTLFETVASVKEK